MILVPFLLALMGIDLQKTFRAFLSRLQCSLSCVTQCLFSFQNITEVDPRTTFERAIEIYDHLNAALEPVDKRCVEKIVCEVGALAGDVGLTQNPLLR